MKKICKTTFIWSQIVFFFCCSPFWGFVIFCRFSPPAETSTISWILCILCILSVSVNLLEFGEFDMNFMSFMNLAVVTHTIRIFNFFLIYFLPISRFCVICQITRKLCFIHNSYMELYLDHVLASFCRACAFFCVAAFFGNWITDIWKKTFYTNVNNIIRIKPKK